MRQRSADKLEELRQKALKKAGVYQRLFSTPDGKKVLDDLKSTFGGKLHVKGDSHDTHVRLGHYEVVQYIHFLLEAQTEDE